MADTCYHTTHLRSMRIWRRSSNQTPTTRRGMHVRHAITFSLVVNVRQSYKHITLAKKPDIDIRTTRLIVYTCPHLFQSQKCINISLGRDVNTFYGIVHMAEAHVLATCFNWAVIEAEAQSHENMILECIVELPAGKCNPKMEGNCAFLIQFSKTFMTKHHMSNKIRHSFFH